MPLTKWCVHFFPFAIPTNEVKVIEFKVKIFCVNIYNHTNNFEVKPILTIIILGWATLRVIYLVQLCKGPLVVFEILIDMYF
jgi:hypothetical protein